MSDPVPAVTEAGATGEIAGIFADIRHVYQVGAALLGAFPTTLTSWFIIFPMKGLPFGGGAASVGMLNALVVNGVWGLGLGILWRFVPGPFRFAHAARGMRPPQQAEWLPGGWRSLDRRGERP